MRKLLVSVAVVALSSAAAIAGDAEDAKAMLEKAAVAIKADREVALAQFNRGQFNRGSLDISKDFYPFCIRLTDGKLIGSPFLAATVGNDVRTGKIGQALYEAIMKQPEGVISGEINYLYPKPGTTAPPLPKTSIAMRVAPDLGCAVGYYK
jgi:hypothetical protein